MESTGGVSRDVAVRAERGLDLLRARRQAHGDPREIRERVLHPLRGPAHLTEGAPFTMWTASKWP